MKVLQESQGSLQQKEQGNTPDPEEKVTKGRILSLLNKLEAYWIGIAEILNYPCLLFSVHVLYSHSTFMKPTGNFSAWVWYRERVMLGSLCSHSSCTNADVNSACSWYSLCCLRMPFFSWSFSFTRTLSLLENLANLDKYALQNLFSFSYHWRLVDSMSQVDTILVCYLYIKSCVKVCSMCRAEQCLAQYFCFSKT